MINQEDIDYFFAQYVSDDFLGRLDPYPKSNLDHRVDAHNNSSVNNDNGILFLAMALLLLHKAGQLPDVKVQVYKAIKRLQVIPGVFNRVPGGTKEEKHDNAIGILILDAIYDLGFAEQINDYGLSNLYNYNNKQPGKLAIRFQRQGGDIAIYQLCARSVVFPGFLLWLTGGLWIAAGKKYPSTINLGWARIELLKLVLKKQKWRLLSRFQVWVAEKGFNFILKKKNISLQWAFKRYFKPDHPIHKFLQ